jgi:mannosylglycoprotein endo-beta-mannosidase
LYQQLISFGHISGLAINGEKSSIYFGRVGEQMKQVILQDMGFVKSLFPFHYLGVPFSPYRLLASQYSPLLQKLESAVQCWQGKHLSYAGRVELIKSVLFGMVHFWLSIFPLPDIVIKQIICICRNFYVD